MSSEKNKINKNDLANGKANGEKNCDETSEAKPKETTIIEEPEAKTGAEASQADQAAQAAAQEASQADQDGEEVLETDERVLPEIDDPNNDR